MPPGAKRRLRVASEFEMGKHRVANHLVQFFEIVRAGENGVTKGFSGISPFRGLAYKKNNLVHVRCR